MREVTTISITALSVVEIGSWNSQPPICAALGPEALLTKTKISQSHRTFVTSFEFYKRTLIHSKTSTPTTI